MGTGERGRPPAFVPGGGLCTERLLLRRWREEDREPFAAMNADHEVMEHFPSVLNREQSDLLADWIDGRMEPQGFGLWAAELLDDGSFIGFVGLNRVPFHAHFTPAVEIGWRLARPYWGRGLATEAAWASLRFGFDQAGLEEIVSFTTPSNRRSIAVMERIGMTRDLHGDFEHPRADVSRSVGPFVLYRLRSHEVAYPP